MGSAGVASRRRALRHGDGTARGLLGRLGRTVIATLAAAAVLVPLGAAAAIADDDELQTDPRRRSASEATLAAARSRQLTVVVVAPLVGPPSTSGVYTPEELAAYTAPDGVLTARLDALADHGIVIAVDPMIVGSILMLGESAPQSALDWLARLEDEDDVLPLLWADADASYAAAATGDLPEPSGFRRPTDAVDAAPIDAMEWDWSGDTLIWPRAGTASGALLRAAGRGEPVLLGTDDVKPVPSIEDDGTEDGGTEDGGEDPDATGPESTTEPTEPTDPTDPGTEPTDPTDPTDPTEPTEPAEPEVPVSARSSVGRSPVYLSLSEQSRLLDGAASGFSTTQRDGDLRRLKRDLRELAETASGSTVLLALGRDTDYNDAALATAIDEIASIRSITLGEWDDVDDASDAVGVRLQRRALLDDRVAQFRQFELATERVAHEAAALIDPEPVLDDTALRTIAQMGNPWLHDAGWAASLEAWRNRTTMLGDAVRIEPASDALVIAESVNVPIAISNAFPGAIRVVVGVDADNDRVRIEQPVVLDVDAESRRSAEVPVRAIANGSTDLTIHLSSEGGAVLDPDEVVRLDIQAGWEVAAASAIVAIVVLLFGFGIVRSIRGRRARRGHRADEPGRADAPDPSDGTTEGTDLP